jgi:hypothetical protein
MSNLQPAEPENHGSRRVNDFIYRRIGEVLVSREPGEILEHPTSSAAQEIEARIASMKAIGIEEQRIRAVSAIAHINLFNRSRAIRSSMPEDFV